MGRNVLFKNKALVDSLLMQVCNHSIHGDVRKTCAQSYKRCVHEVIFFGAGEEGMDYEIAVVDQAL